MKKLKKLSKFKAVALVLALVLGLSLVGTGAAFAAGTFTVHTTTVSGTVSEAITISCTAGDGSWLAGVWTVTAYPNEVKTLTLRASNAGSADIVITVAETSGNIAGCGDYNAPAGSFVDVTLTWTVPSDATPDTYLYDITFKR